MELFIKHFSELSAEELFEIYKVRVSVFVVEQKCLYHEVDDADKAAYHIWIKGEDGIQAYARVLPCGTVSEDVSIGRVLAVKRHCGLGSKIVESAIRVAREKLLANCVTLNAQLYVKSLYEKLGFVQVSEPFDDVGIQHIKMKLQL